MQMDKGKRLLLFENVCPWAGKLMATDCHGKVLSLRSIAKLWSNMGNKRRMEIYVI